MLGKSGINTSQKLTLGTKNQPRIGWIPASNSEQWDGAGTAGEMAGGTL